jgi:hypothetical protein
MRITLLALAFLVFVAVEIAAIATFGYLGVFEALASNAATRLGLLDLVLSLTLVLIWMRQDAEERALPFWPYAVVTVALGVAGPLAYLIYRELHDARSTSPQRV